MRVSRHSQVNDRDAEGRIGSTTPPEEPRAAGRVRAERSSWSPDHFFPPRPRITSQL